MKKSLVAILLIFCLLLTGCELTENFTDDLLGTGEKEEVITTLNHLSLLYFPGRDVHPLLDTSLANQKLHTAIFLPAVSYTENNQLVYGCATEVVQKGSSISITPDTSRKFSDGSALSAKDIVQSFNFVLSHPQSPYYRQLSSVKQVSEQNGRVVITLLGGDPGALYCLDIPIVKQGGKQDAQYFGCGDYMLSSYNNVPVLVANPHTANPPSTTPIYLVTPDNGQALGAMFNSGVLDVLSADLIEQGAFSVSRQYDTVSYLTPTMIYIGANARQSKLSAATRRALSALIPRQDIIQTVLMGQGQAADLPFYPGWDKVPAVQAQADKQRLIELFTAAGLHEKNGDLLTSENQKPQYDILVCKDSKEHVAVAEKFRSAALALGIEITIKEVDQSTFLSRLEKGSFDLYVARYTLNKNMDAAQLFVGEGGTNYGGFDDPVLTNAHTAYLENGDAAAYVSVLQRECPILTVAFLKNTLYYTKGITPGGQISHSRPLGDLTKWTMK